MQKTNEKKIAKLNHMCEEGYGIIYEGYSGRGMYGRKCYGITTTNPERCIEEAVARGIREAS